MAPSTPAGQHQCMLVYHPVKFDCCRAFETGKKSHKYLSHLIKKSIVPSRGIKTNSFLLLLIYLVITMLYSPLFTNKIIPKVSPISKTTNPIEWSDYRPISTLPAGIVKPNKTIDITNKIALITGQSNSTILWKTKKLQVEKKKSPEIKRIEENVSHIPQFVDVYFSNSTGSIFPCRFCIFDVECLC